MFEELIAGIVLADFTATLVTAAAVYIRVDALNNRIDKLSDRLLVLETKYSNSQKHLDK